jgi:hypothetical protein
MENPSGNSAGRRLDFPAGAVKQNVGWRPSNETIAPIEGRAYSFGANGAPMLYLPVSTSQGGIGDAAQDVREAEPC